MATTVDLCSYRLLAAACEAELRVMASITLDLPRSYVGITDASKLTADVQAGKLWLTSRGSCRLVTHFTDNSDATSITQIGSDRSIASEARSAVESCPLWDSLGLCLTPCLEIDAPGFPARLNFDWKIDHQERSSSLFTPPTTPVGYVGEIKLNFDIDRTIFRGSSKGMSGGKSIGAPSIPQRQSKRLAPLKEIVPRLNHDVSTQPTFGSPTGIATSLEASLGASKQLLGMPRLVFVRLVHAAIYSGFWGPKKHPQLSIRGPSGQGSLLAIAPGICSLPYFQTINSLFGLVGSIASNLASLQNAQSADLRHKLAGLASYSNGHSDNGSAAESVLKELTTRLQDLVLSKTKPPKPKVPAPRKPAPQPKRKQPITGRKLVRRQRPAVSTVGFVEQGFQYGFDCIEDSGEHDRVNGQLLDDEWQPDGCDSRLRSPQSTGAEYFDPCTSPVHDLQRNPVDGRSAQAYPDYADDGLLYRQTYSFEELSEFKSIAEYRQYRCSDHPVELLEGDAQLFRGDLSGDAGAWTEILRTDYTQVTRAQHEGSAPANQHGVLAGWRQRAELPDRVTLEHGEPWMEYERPCLEWRTNTDDGARSDTYPEDDYRGQEDDHNDLHDEVDERLCHNGHDEVVYDNTERDENGVTFGEAEAELNSTPYYEGEDAICSDDYYDGDHATGNRDLYDGDGAAYSDTCYDGGDCDDYGDACYDSD